MKKAISLLLLLSTAIILTGCNRHPVASTPRPQPTEANVPTPSRPAETSQPTPTQNSSHGGEMSWNRVCMDATTKALEMEISRYNSWLGNASASKKKMYRNALDYLQRELKKYQQMDPADYKPGDACHSIPGVEIGTYGKTKCKCPSEPITVEAWVREKLPGMLDYKGESRSGPFYIATGIKGGDFSVIKRGVHYDMTLYPLLPESYPFPSTYVCIGAFKVAR